MLKEYNKKIILFPAGTSGNFLASFLTTTDVQLSPNFRIDWNQANKAIDFIGPRKFDRYNESAYLESVNQWVQQEKGHTMISHYLGISNLLKYNDICWIRKIVSGKHILSHCKNVFYKKQELEFVSYQTTMPVLVDGMMMNIGDFYNQHKLDYDRPDGYLIEFSKLQNIEYLIELYTEVNQAPPSLQQINWAEEYISKQFCLYEYPTSTVMSDIVSLIKPKDTFDVAAVLFTYENNWNTVDQNRLWSIDDLPNSVEDAVQFLLSNERNYTFFKD